MVPVPRHQCFIYDGSASRGIPCLGKAIRHMLSRHYRCLYLNSAPMIEEMRIYLAESGLYVAREMQKGNLILSSDRDHLMNGAFNLESMLAGLESALRDALNEGYAGLFATGDMTWEFGPEADFGQLVEYEWRLEEFFEKHPQLSGICQYDASTMPQPALHQGLSAHAGIFLSEDLTIPNPQFESPAQARARVSA